MTNIMPADCMAILEAWASGEIEAVWHIYASVKHTNIGSDNGLLLGQC